MFWGSVGCVPILEGKLEFPSYLALVLVPHWIGDGRLSSIYTNFSLAYHIPTRARTRRIEPGMVRVARAYDPRTRMQFDSGVLEPEIFFLVYPFYFKKSV